MSADSTQRGGRYDRGTRIYEDLAASDALRYEVGARIARWIAREPEKEAARAFGVSPRTVKSWRAGQLPQMRHLMAMASRWGEAFLDDVFAPVLVHDAKLTVRLERLEAEIAAIRREVTRATTQSAEAEPADVSRVNDELGINPLLQVIPGDKAVEKAGTEVDRSALPEPRPWE